MQLQLEDLCRAAGLTPEEIADLSDYARDKKLADVLQMVCANVQPISSQEKLDFAAVPSEVYALSEAQLDAEIAALSRLQETSLINKHDCEVVVYLEQIVLDLARLKQLATDPVARENQKEIQAGFNAYQETFEGFLQQLTEFLHGYTAFKPKMTAFQPGLVQQLDLQAKQVRELVGEATKNSMDPATKERLLFVYAEAYRVHKQLVGLRTYENQLQQVVQATTFQQQFNQQSKLTFNEDPTPREIQNEVSILQELQEENVRLNAEINASFQHQFDRETMHLIEVVLKAINEDLLRVCGKLKRIFDFLQDCIAQVSKIVDRISVEHQTLEGCYQACQEQLAALQRTNQIVQDVIQNQMHTQTQINELRSSPITVLGIDAVFEPYSDRLLSILGHVNDLEQDLLAPKGPQEVEERALCRQNEVLHQKGKVLDLFNGLEARDDVDAIEEAVRAAEFRMRQLMQ